MEKEIKDLNEIQEYVYLKLLNKNTIIPGLEKIVLSSIVKKSKKLSEYIYEKQFITNEHCEYCYDKNANLKFCNEVYLSPFNNDPEIYYYCSENCQNNDYYDESFYCENCDRTIVTHNGYNSYYRNYRDEIICLSCFEKIMFEDGLSIEDIEKNALQGMFFNYGELSDNGYTEYQTYFINSKYDEQKIKEILLGLKKENKKVVINYERLSICGDEGSISIWIK